jgi:hypothetical protein
MLLSEVINEIMSGTVVLDNTSIAELTRQRYLDQYNKSIVPQQFIPIFTYEINTSKCAIVNNSYFLYADLSMADDWICINATNSIT